MSATSNHDVAQRLALTTHQLADGVTVLSVGGELDLWTAPTLCQRVEQSLDAPLIIDLTELQFCDSTGLRALFGAAHEARVRCARVLFLPPAHSGAARAFELAGATEMLPLARDAEQALARFGD